MSAAHSSSFLASVDTHLLVSVALYVLIPLVGLFTLLHAKLSVGAAARRGERRFIAVLIGITAVTAMTATGAGEGWLLHAGTLAVMIVGGLALPGHGHHDVASMNAAPMISEV